MDNTVVVAIIAAVGGLLVALVQRLRTENKGDHALVTEAIRLMHCDVREVRRDVHNHLAWHAGDKNNDGTKQRDTSSTDKAQ